MIVKGGSRSSAAYWSKHLLRADHNEQVQILEMPYGRADTGAALYKSLRQFQDMAKLTGKGEKGLYCGHIDPDGKYAMSAANWQTSVALMEAELGLKGQPRVVVKHTKDDRDHVHVIWQRARLDRETGQWTLISDGWNYKKHELAARQMEKTFGHDHVKGVFTGRDRDPETGRCLDERPVADLNHADWQQAERTGKDPKAVKAGIAALWRDHKDGSAFKGALEQSGYRLAQGDKKPVYMVVDRSGEAYELRRCIKGVKKPEIEERLAAYPVKELETVADIRAALREQRQEQQQQGQQGQQRPPVRLRKDGWLKGRFRAANDNRILREGQTRQRRELELEAEIAVPMQRRAAAQAAFTQSAQAGRSTRTAQLAALDDERDRYEAQIRTEKRNQRIVDKQAELYELRNAMTLRHLDDTRKMEAGHDRQTASKEAELEPVYGRSIRRLESSIAAARERLEQGGTVYGLLFAWRDRQTVAAKTATLENARQREAEAWQPLRNRQREERGRVEKSQGDELRRMDDWIRDTLQEFERSLDPAHERDTTREQRQEHSQQQTRGDAGGGTGRSRSLTAQASARVKPLSRRSLPLRLTGRGRRRREWKYEMGLAGEVPKRGQRYTTDSKVKPRKGTSPRRAWTANARELVQVQRTPAPHGPGYRPTIAPRPGF